MLFQQVDADQSGALSLEEIAGALSAVELPFEVSQEHLQFVHGQFDANSDGEVDIEGTVFFLLDCHSYCILHYD